MRKIAAPLISFLVACPAYAQPTDIASQPMTYSMASQVKPNVMFILDDSGSMASRFMPEEVANTRVDKSRCNNSSCSSTTTDGIEGNPPWYSPQFNSLYYNPQITYFPAVNADGTQRTSYGSPWTAVPRNAFVAAGTINLVSGYPELVYCRNSDDDPYDTTNCRRNGINTTNPFQYTTATANGFPNGTGNGAFRFPRTRGGNPFYYAMLPREHCTTADLRDCTLSATPTGSYRFPAVVRWCRNTTDANSASAISGLSSGQPRCQRSYDSNHTHPRYGQFQRTDIVPATATYGGRPNRTDCASAPSCSYAEEMTNFANWYAYYSTRMQLMKTGVGYAFLQLDSRYRVGLITINPGSPVASSKYLRVDTFAETHRADWYTKLYSQNPSGGTPLRQALSRVGRHYAGRQDSINSGMTGDPVQYSCQPNVAILSTDGYWNGAAGMRINGSAIGNNDNVNAGYSTRSSGAFDGALSGANDNLADVAMYYYSADLRPPGSTGALGTDVSENDVPGTSRDTNPAQHMLTFTVGLGLGGLMKFIPDYEAATSGDYYDIKTGNTNCSWVGSGQICNWPVPPLNDNDDPRKIDDLWHAAVNGRGRYVSASDAPSLYDGLVNALSDLQVLIGAASASATSSPNITATDNAIFSSTYRTSRWDGELVAQRVDPVSGVVSTAEQWSARTLLNAQVAAAGDTRTIYANVGGALTSFLWTNLDAATQPFFSGKCPQLSQCVDFDAAQRTTVDSGVNLVNFLRGQRQHEPLYREREYVLGDLVTSRPMYVRDPRRSYGDPVNPSYFDFKHLNASRRAVVYIGGNDGMLHAFDATNGAELWAFVPRSVMPEMFRLADAAYATSHRFYVDGTPAVGDVIISNQWRTILIGGLNAGGRGYYALDITDPLNPRLLWELCNNPTLCSVSDADIGLSFGNPVITKRSIDGRWVALLTSGYNNIGGGDGRGYLYVVDVATGAILNKVSTGVGSATDPSGLTKITAWAHEPDTNNTTQYVYGGDLEGNVWRFDLGAAPPGVLRLATLRDGAGKPQSITVRPELGQIDNQRVIFVGTGRYLGVSDLQDPATLVPPADWSYIGTLYAIKDGGSALGSPRDLTTFVPKTVTTISSNQRGITGGTVNWSSDSGWYVDFPSTGERINIDLHLTLGTLVVTSNIPNNNACTAGGDSWIYQFDYRDGQKVSTATEAGLYRSGTLTVGNALVRLQGVLLKIITTGASGVKETRGLNVGSGSMTARRIGWREVAR
jgi:type IV pilus assembly protein PilY1